MDVRETGAAIVFGRTKRRVDELTRGLKDPWFPEQKGFTEIWIKQTSSCTSWL